MSVKFNVKRYFQVLGISLAVILLGVLVCLGMDFVEKPGDQQSVVSTVEAADGKINVLLMGVDVEGLRTDAIMVASYDTDKNEVNMLSIPRDTRMYVGTKYQKINAAHAIGGMTGKIAGPEGTIEAVTRLTGIPINYYVEFSFDAVANVIDTLGPITFEIPDLYNDGVGMVYDDPVQDLHINLKPGVQELNGQQVVQLLRYRKGNKKADGTRDSYLDGDRGRMDVQQQFLKALVDQKLNASLIMKIPALFKQMSSDLKTNLTLPDVIKYSKYLNNFSSTGIHTHTLPGHDSGDEYAESFWICDLDETRELVETVFGYDASKITIDKSGSTASNTVAPGSGSTAKPKTTPKATAANKSTTKPKATSSAKGTTKSGGQEEEPKATAKPKSQDNGGSSNSNGNSKATAKPKVTAAPQEPAKSAAPSKATSKPAQKTPTPVKNEVDDEENSDE